MVSRGSSGGPMRVTDVVTLRSGFEQRNTIWANSRRAYDAGLGIQNIENLYEVIEFYEGRRGKLFGFRWKDWADYKSKGPTSAISPNDVEIGIGDGSNTQFQLIKIYSSNLNPYTRKINKPVSGTVTVTVNNAITIDFSVDYTTGMINLFSPPPIGHSVKAGFEFDVPVRFNVNELIVNVEHFNVGAVPNIDVVEVRL